MGISVRYYVFRGNRAPQSLSRRLVEGLTSGLSRKPQMFLLALAFVVPVHAALAASELPGGANSLREVYDNWVLDCGIQKKDSGPVVACAVSAQQVDQSSKRRVLGIGLSPSEEAGAKGSIIMPFGLDLQKGVTLQIDDGPVTSALPFRTCLPSGCIISLDWKQPSVEALRSGTNLKVSATADDGHPVNLSLPLKGFSSGLDRAVELTK